MNNDGRFSIWIFTWLWLFPHLIDAPAKKTYLRNVALQLINLLANASKTILLFFDCLFVYGSRQVIWAWASYYIRKKLLKCFRRVTEENNWFLTPAFALSISKRAISGFYF